MAAAIDAVGRVVVSLVEPGGAVPLLGAADLERLRAAGLQVRVRPRPAGLRSEELAAWIGSDAWAVLTSWGCPAFTAPALAGLGRLACIGHIAGSVRGLVTPEAFARGVTVLSAAPVIATGVAEYCLTMALWVLRDIATSVSALSAAPGADGWRAGKKPPTSQSLWGRGVGIVAASSTGRRFIELLRPFGCQVLVYDPYLPESEATRLGVRRAGLLEVCGQSLVSVHAPDLPATQGLVGEAALARIPDGALFINSARAAVIDYGALTAHLLQRRFRAVLDVFPQEPLPAGSPLYGLPNVVLTPHLAGYSADVYAGMGRAIVSDVLRLARGAPAEMAVDAARWEALA